MTERMRISLERSVALVAGPDGGHQVIINRRRHVDRAHLAIHIDVLKKRWKVWPGESELPTDADRWRERFTSECVPLGKTEISVVVPGSTLPTKGHLQILIDVLKRSLQGWPKTQSPKRLPRPWVIPGEMRDYAERVIAALPSGSIPAPVSVGEIQALTLMTTKYFDEFLKQPAAIARSEEEFSGEKNSQDEGDRENAVMDRG